MNFFSDIRFGVRMLRKRPAITIAAIVILALGIGASSAILTLIHSVLLSPLPYPQPEQLVALFATHPQYGSLAARFSFPDYKDFRQRNQTFAEVGGQQTMGFNLTGHDRPEMLSGKMVSSSFWKVLGVEPQLGRTFTPDEDAVGTGAPVTVISDSLWQRLFARDPKALGASLQLNDHPYTIVGIMPPGFRFGADDEIWTPLAPAYADSGRGNHPIAVIGRMKQGITLAVAAADASSVAAQLQREFPDADDQEGIRVQSFRDWIVGTDFRQSLWILAGAVAFVLLIACSNVANLLLVRAAERRGEMAVRMALGASASRLVRQLLVESTILALAGGVLGMLAGVWCVAALKLFGGNKIPRLEQVAPDAVVFAAAFGLTLLSSILFGLAPALRSSRADVNADLKFAGRTGSSTRGRDTLRSLLVISEVALSLVLLAGAGLLIRSYMKLSEKGPGFSEKNLITARVNLPRARYDTVAAVNGLLSRLEERVRAIPGVGAAGYVSLAPFRDGNFIMDLEFEGRASTANNANLSSNYRQASAGYLEALGVPLIAGRTISDRDSADAARVAVVSQEFARRFFPGASAVGQMFRPFGGGNKTAQIIGVVGDVNYGSLESKPEPMVYLAALQVPNAQSTFLVRATANGDAVISAMREALRAEDPTLPLIGARTVSEDISASLTPRKFNLLLLGGFAGLAIVLAIVGIFGVMSYTVTQRRQEIGIRMALGAQSADILRLTLRQGLTLVLTGIAIGICGAFALTRLMATMLYGVNAQDPVTYASVAILFAAVALAACWIPSYNASQLDPITALKYE